MQLRSRSFQLTYRKRVKNGQVVDQGSGIIMGAMNFSETLAGILPFQLLKRVSSLLHDKRAYISLEFSIDDAAFIDYYKNE